MGYLPSFCALVVAGGGGNSIIMTAGIHHASQLEAGRLPEVCATTAGIHHASQLEAGRLPDIDGNHLDSQSGVGVNTLPGGCCATWQVPRQR